MKRQRIWGFLAILMASLLTACGGGSATSTETAATPAKVEILDGAALLTEAGQTRALSARVLDSHGRDITATVAWESSRPENVGVSASGELTAVGSGGSSQITARVGNLRSAPMLAVHTPVAAGAELLTDEQIVGEPEETSPGATPSASNTYRVRLSGVASPAVGDLLVNTGGKIVAGRVLAVQSIDGIHHVTLALVPARELFPRLNIDEVIDLNEADVEIPEAIAAQYDVQRVGNTFTFTPKPGQVSLSARAVQQPLASSGGRAKAQALGDDFTLGPFACKPAVDGAAGAGSEVIALTVPPLFTVSLNPRLDILSTEANGLERLVLHSEPSVSIEAGLKTLLAVEGKVTCEADLFVIKIPVGGPVALIVGGQLPVGVGVELGGKLTAVNMGITVKGTARTSGDVGLACPAAMGCAVVSEFGKLDVTATPTSDPPSLTGGDLRLEPTLSAYAFVKAAIGNPFLKSLRFDAFKVKAGMALKGNFAPQSTQASDAAYQSDYKLVSELKAGADTGFSGLAGFLGLNAFAETLLEVSVDVATTPGGALSADRAAFAGGDTVNFKVRLDPGKADFLDVYNVERVILVRHKPFLGVTEVGSVTASENQTEFDFVFTSPIGASGGRADEFYAFVVTKLLPFDVFALELGRASAASTGLKGSMTLAVTDVAAVREPGASSDSLTRLNLTARVEERDGVLVVLEPSGSAMQETSSVTYLEFFTPEGERKCNVEIRATTTKTLSQPVSGGESGLGVTGNSVINTGMTILQGTITAVTTLSKTTENYNNDSDMCEGHIDSETQTTSTAPGQLEVFLSKARSALFRAEATTDGQGLRRLQHTEVWADVFGSSATIDLNLTDEAR